VALLAIKSRSALRLSTLLMNLQASHFPQATIPPGTVFKGVTGSTPPEMLTSKFSTLFQHISAVAVVNIVTILSRSIAFSVHLKRSLTFIKC